METMDPEERAEIIIAKLQGQAAYAYERSPFYQKRWGEAGFHPSQLRTIDDVRRIPIITKEDLRQDLLDNPPFGSNICDDWGNILRVHGSSGTTGIPTVIAISADDWARIGEAHARVEWGAGVRPGDTVFMAAPFSLYMGAWGMLVGAERMGAKCFPFGAGAPGQTRMAVRWCLAATPSVFYGTPSFALYLAETAREEGVDPRAFGFRTLFFSGEARRVHPRDAARPRGDVTAPSVIDSALHRRDVAVDDERRLPPRGRHAPVAGHRVHAARRPRDARGRPLRRRGRARVHAPRTDVAAPHPVLVGRPRELDGRAVRVRAHVPDDAARDLRTRRRLWSWCAARTCTPAPSRNVVRAVPGLTGEFRMVVSRERTMDELTVLAELAGGDPDETRRKLASDLGATLGIRANVELKAPGELERTQFKARRVIDERDL